MPRFVIKEKNYNNKPSWEQRQLLDFCGIPHPPTLIEAHLKIKEFGATESGKAKLSEWPAEKARRKEQRRSHATAGSTGNAQRA